MAVNSDVVVANKFRRVKTDGPNTTVTTLTAANLVAPVITGAMTVATGATLTAPLSTRKIEVVAATNLITAAESGTVFFLNSATEFVSTLPAPAAGLHFTFIVTGAPSGASYTVIGASGTPIHGMVLSKDLNGATDSGATAGTGVLTLTFVDGKSVKGDRADFVSDGTDWFVVAVTGGTFDAITLS
jgi:hypothetical protein